MIINLDHADIEYAWQERGSRMENLGLRSHHITAMGLHAAGFQVTYRASARKLSALILKVFQQFA
jgi:hypothetical protein